jgi:hypothetical protein
VAGDGPSPVINRRKQATGSIGHATIPQKLAERAQSRDRPRRMAGSDVCDRRRIGIDAPWKVGE